MYQGLSEKALKTRNKPCLIFYIQIDFYIEQKASLKQAPVGILFCDTFIFLTHQKRQCVIQD